MISLEEVSAPKSNPSRPSSGQSRKFEAFLFFCSGIGSTVAWTAVLSNLVFYTMHLGAASYIYLNLAVYAPLLPMSLIQAKWDAYFDKEYSSLNTFLFRGSFSYAFAVVTILLTPSASNNLGLLTILSIILGTTSATLQGTLKQMASFVYEDSALFQSAVSSGMQGSSIFVLVTALATGFGDSGDTDGLLAFNNTILGLKIFCWISFYILMTRSSVMVKAMSKRDLSLSQHESLSPVDDSQKGMISSRKADIEPMPLMPLLSHQKDEVSNIELDYWTLWKKSQIYCISLIITLIASMLIAAYLNRVPSQDPNNVNFAQILFYAKMIPDVLGRPFTIFWKPKSESFVLTVTLLRLLYVPIFMLYVLTDLIPRNDFWITTGLVVFSFFSGYVVTAAYQLAPDALSENEKSNMPKQANLLNICFSASLLIGLLMGLIVLLCVNDLNDEN